MLLGFAASAPPDLLLEDLDQESDQGRGHSQGRKQSQDPSKETGDLTCLSAEIQGKGQAVDEVTDAKRQREGAENQPDDDPGEKRPSPKDFQNALFLVHVLAHPSS